MPKMQLKMQHPIIRKLKKWSIINFMPLKRKAMVPELSVLTKLSYISNYHNNNHRSLKIFLNTLNKSRSKPIKTLWGLTLLNIPKEASMQMIAPMILLSCQKVWVLNLMDCKFLLHYKINSKATIPPLDSIIRLLSSSNCGNHPLLNRMTVENWLEQGNMTWMISLKILISKKIYKR